MSWWDSLLLYDLMYANKKRLKRKDMPCLRTNKNKTDELRNLLNQ
jgi:hypothetical protein